uniref:P2Y purinoceptor 1-like n=1 Tax=Myxine glutinosa TaxID=7769 RepID=UPI00358E6DFB
MNSKIIVNTLTTLIPDGDGGNSSMPCLLDKAFQYVVLPTFYSISFIFGLAGNLFALGFFCSSRMRPWNAITVYLFNLALADLLYITTLPFLISYYINQTDWPFGEALCRISRFVFHLNLYGSIFFLTCISMHRYAGVVHPLRALGRLHRRHAVLISFCVWLYVTILLLPSVVFSDTGSNKSNGMTCYDTAPSDSLKAYQTYNTVLTVMGFGLPFVVTLICYGFVVRTLRTRVRPRGASLRSRSLWLVAVVLVSFSLCFFPYHIMRSLNIWSRLHLGLKPSTCSISRTIYATYQVTRGMASINSCLDPVLYFLAGDAFRRRVRWTTRRNGTSGKDAIIGPLSLQSISNEPATAKPHAACPLNYMQGGRESGVEA